MSNFFELLFFSRHKDGTPVAILFQNFMFNHNYELVWTKIIHKWMETFH